jgi:hypothetical protein
MRERGQDRLTQRRESPADALALIRRWAQLNRAALEANWSKIQTGQALDRIPPLE